MGRLFKTKGVWLLFLALIAGVLLMILPEGGESKSVTDFPESEEYRKSLEEQTRSLIRSLEGVSDCRVMITLESGYEYLYAAEQTLDRTYDSSGTLLSSNSGKKYILDGDGNPIIISETPPAISGIAVVAKNISAETRYRIIRLLEGAYGIPSNRISVES
ncbi:MAG: hypothetical protein J6A85_00045 [Clostridia bacterium]|nr:hypothetical protein [Clostridia bacterium]